MSSQRLCLKIKGTVQGVGFRPFVYRLAKELGLRGWVKNDVAGVVIEIEGDISQLNLFQAQLISEQPARSHIHSITSEWRDVVNDRDFQILASSQYFRDDEIKTAIILPDLATCEDCLQDIRDSQNRRDRYAFTNCTNCGPRYSIMTALPYDRHNTTMRNFVMCADCATEYDNPLDRRFHAQPNACPICGPQLELWDHDRQVVAAGDHALMETVQAIQKGQILAIKGLGGFHLVVDAANLEAITKLRERKHRPHKPLALMYPNLELLAQDCEVSELEMQLLQSVVAPIVLLKKRYVSVRPCIADQNAYIGAMLPYTPLHHLLMAELQTPIVATSGNRAEEPICIDNQEAIVNLGEIADLFLVHNRDIAQPVDDSIVRVIGDQSMVIRSARGLAPLAIDYPLYPQFLPTTNSRILAVGGHLKNTIALSFPQETEQSIILSQHIGDLGTTATLEHCQQIRQQLSDAYGFVPRAIACDLHPDYISSQYAQQLSQAWHIPLIPVQHHYAHVLANMADHQLQPEVLGIAWDGSGYGTDGTIWGGEFLKVTETGFERVAHLRRFKLLGGERAVKEPRRMALSLLWEVYGDLLWSIDSEVMRSVRQSFSQSELAILPTLLSKQNLMQTSSMGRLFDGVAALLGICEIVSFEGQAAIALESLCERTETTDFYQFDVKKNSELDWTGVISSILEDRLNYVDIATIAVKFHNTLVEMIVYMAMQVGLKQVVLTGGCFQNRYLMEKAIAKLTQLGFCAYGHRRIPANDAGLAVGQVIAAMMVLKIN
jgi:hydrogenase maturation protein HypF